MKFNGKQLFDLKCPQTRIKFLIGREFESEEAARAEFSPEKEVKVKEDYSDSIFSFLAGLPRTYLPMMFNGDRPERMSNSELRRLLDSKGVIVNGKTPAANDSFEFPITELIFFSKSARKTTMIKGDESPLDPLPLNLSKI